MSIRPLDSDGGQSLDHFHGNMQKDAFVLKGLNKPWKSGGFNSIYATVEYGKEDWFHCAFDENIFPADRLSALFDLFKNSEDNLWHDKIHKVLVEFEKLSSSGCPVNPVIKKLYLNI